MFNSLYRKPCDYHMVYGYGVFARNIRKFWRRQIRLREKIGIRSDKTTPYFHYRNYNFLSDKFLTLRKSTFVDVSNSTDLKKSRNSLTVSERQTVNLWSIHYTENLRAYPHFQMMMREFVWFLNLVFSCTGCCMKVACLLDLHTLFERVRVFSKFECVGVLPVSCIYTHTWHLHVKSGLFFRIFDVNMYAKLFKAEPRFLMYCQKNRSLLAQTTLRNILYKPSVFYPFLRNEHKWWQMAAARLSHCYTVQQITRLEWIFLTVTSRDL